MLPSLNQKCRVVSSECQLMCPYFSEKYCTLQNLTQGVVLNSPMLSVYHPPHQSVFMQQLKTVQVVNTRSLQGYSYVYFTSYYELIFGNFEPSLLRINKSKSSNSAKDRAERDTKLRY